MIRYLPLLVALALARPVHADCYDTAGLAAHRPPLARDVMVAVDETTVVPDDLRETLHGMLGAMLRPGDRVTVIAFSSFNRNHYLREVMVRTIEQAPPQSVQMNMPSRKLKALLPCVTGNQKTALDEVKTTAMLLVEKATADISHSEIVMSMRELGLRLRTSPAKDRLMLIVSDGIEHSSVTSFYRNRGLREIGPTDELAKVRKKNAIADLGGTRVFWFGGGLGASTDGYLDQTRLLHLETFWSGYIKESKGTLVSFGKPSLMNNKFD